MTVDDGQAVNDRMFVFRVLENEAAMRFGFSAVTVNDAVFRAVGTSQGDDLTFKVDISIAGA